MAAVTAAPERFDLGRVFSGGFEIVGRRPLTFIVITAIFGYLPAAATLWFSTHWIAPATTGAVGLAAVGPALQRLAISEVIVVLIGGLGWILQGALAAAALSDYGDHPMGVGEALARAAPRMPVVYVVGVLATVAIVAATFVFIIPGVLLALAWSLGGIVATVENTGFKAFGRSAALTRGNRLSIFVIFLVFWVAALVLGFAARAIGGAPLLAGAGTEPLWVTLGLQPLAGAVVQIFQTATLIAAYVELRGVRDGLTASSLASLFD